MHMFGPRMIGLFQRQLDQSPDGYLWSNAVTATGILVKRGLIVPPSAVPIQAVGVGLAAPILASGHGLTTGDECLIAGVTGATPSVNGNFVPTVIDVNNFTIPVHTTIAGTGFGTVQQIYAVIGEIKEVTPSGANRNKIETSTHNDGAESHVLGILRHPDPGLKINYIGSLASHAAIWADLLNNTKNNWKILFPSGTYRVGVGYVQGFIYDPVPMDAEQAATITLTYAGPVTEFAM